MTDEALRPGLDPERLNRAMEAAMAAVDDEWTIREFADLTAAEYARLAADAATDEAEREWSQPLPQDIR